MSPLDQLKAFARYKTHPGYRWAAVCADGELLCEACVRENYRQVYGATKRQDNAQWQVVGLTNSGDDEGWTACSNCNKVLWEEI